MLELVIKELGPVSLDRLGFKFLSTGGPEGPRGPGTAVEDECNVSTAAGPEGGFLSGLRRLSMAGGGWAMVGGIGWLELVEVVVAVVAPRDSTDVVDAGVTRS